MYASRGWPRLPEPLISPASNWPEELRKKFLNVVSSWSRQIESLYVGLHACAASGIIPGNGVPVPALPPSIKRAVESSFTMRNMVLVAGGGVVAIPQQAYVYAPRSVPSVVPVGSRGAEQSTSQVAKGFQTQSIASYI